MDMLPVENENPEVLRLGTDEVTVLATSAQTGGALFAVGIRMAPGGGPPVMHRHDPGEVYYVVEGSSPSTSGSSRKFDGSRPQQALSCRLPVAHPTRSAMSLTPTLWLSSCTLRAHRWRASRALRRPLLAPANQAWTRCWQWPRTMASSYWVPSRQFPGHHRLRRNRLLVLLRSCLPKNAGRLDLCSMAPGSYLAGDWVGEACWRVADRSQP